ncbi:LysR family transcriptional regulator [Comamonas sp. Y33R10-2]|uniref:LysR family transcriptional regulator n=1 Tax=Comamonas sp. Y33R10-2 TaxID=2853257 RepID=UPI001C5CA7FA|nr:LysR family transcriptional regulator [Comamonas sp. Y33R10-2]
MQPAAHVDAVASISSEVRLRYRPNLLRFDLASLQLVVLCADLGSLTVAVKQLHCSLSTGSYRLSALEDALGVLIFLRDHQGLQLTREGDHIIGRCRTILALVEQMQAKT